MKKSNYTKNAGWDKIEKAVSMDAFIISNEASDALNKFIFNDYLEISFVDD
jgi:hypothetical protein